MERLLKDAEKLTGVKYDISNLADVYSAIHAIQENLGIAGTTAAEAEKTITGAANMTKAAWKNVLTAMAVGGDLDRAMKNLAYSVQKYFQNIVPVVERALSGIGTVIENIAPTLVKTVVRSFIKAIPTLINSIYSMMIGAVNGISDAMGELFKGGEEEQLEKQVETIDKAAESQNKLTEAVEETEKAQKGALAGFDEINTLASATADEELALDATGSGTIGGATITPEVDTEPATMSLSEFIDKLLGEFLPKAVSVVGLIITKLVQTIPSAIQSLVDNADVVLDTIIDLVESIVIMLPDLIESLTSTFPVLFPKIFSAIVSLIDLIISNLENILKPIIDSIPDTLITITEALTDNLPTIISGIISLVMIIVRNLPKIFSKVAEAIPTVIELLTTALLQNLPLIIWGLIQVVGGIIVSLPEIFSSMVSAIVGVFVGIWNALGNVFGDVGAWINEKVVQPIIGFFEKLWGALKNGVKNFVNFYIGIINGLITAFESLINFYIKAINWFIRAINKIKFDVPDWVPEIGGKTLGFNLKEVSEVSLGRIPKLAQGAVVPPNKEFMAILGDNKKETEIVSPLSTMKQAMIEALTATGAYRGDNAPIILQVDGREIARATRDGNERLGAQTVFGGFANAY